MLFTETGKAGGEEDLNGGESKSSVWDLLSLRCL